MEFLSRQWISERFRLATSTRWLPDVDIRIQHVVTQAPQGTVRYYDDIRGGVLAASGLGTIEVPDVTITNLWADEVAVMRGEADMFDVLMAGRVDVTGDHGRLFILVPTLASPAVRGLARVLLNAKDPAEVSVAVGVPHDALS